MGDGTAGWGFHAAQVARPNAGSTIPMPRPSAKAAPWCPLRNGTSIAAVSWGLFLPKLARVRAERVPLRHRGPRRRASGSGGVGRVRGGAGGARSGGLPGQRRLALAPAFRRGSGFGHTLDEAQERPREVEHELYFRGCVLVFVVFHSVVLVLRESTEQKIVVDVADLAVGVVS